MTVDDIFEKATLNWRNCKGIGTALVPQPFNDKVLVYQILTRFYTRNPCMHTIIIVNDFTQRQELTTFLINTGDENNDNEFKKLIDNKYIRIFTLSFLVERWNRVEDLVIWYRPDEHNDTVCKYINRFRFRLVVLNKLISSNELYKSTPLLDCFKQAELDELRISSPVEETWIAVSIPEDSETDRLYKHYCKYVETSLNIFGSFEIMQQARLGNSTLNISSAEICEQIASENGWNEHLDMSYEYNKKIDELYNPNNLRERASQTYEVIRNRSNLLSDYEPKLENVLEVVNAHSGEKILIISKRGEFANKVTDYLNNNSETDICGNYHNKVDNIEAVDVDGKPIYIKSGPEKGKRKMLGAKGQMTLNEKRYNLGKIHCLSLSNAPDKSLTVDVDIVIITSPQCEDIKSYLYRLSNVRIRSNIIKLFSIFCKNTLEQQKLYNKELTETHKIVNKSEFDAEIENKIDFLIAD